MKRFVLAFGIAALACLSALPGQAADKLRVATSFKGLWDTTMVQFGYDKGIFAAEGLDLDIVWMSGGGVDTLQTVIAGGADIGVGIGTVGAMAAVAKGAPVAIIGSEFTGASDVFFYARTDSKIAAFKDLNGKKLGVAHQGSTTQTVASLMASSLGIKPEFVVTGGPPGTMTQVMTGQVDAGWSVFPIGMDKVASGELRIIGLGNDAPGVANEAMRVTVGNKDFVQKNQALVQRFFAAYKKTLDWAYSGDEALAKYAELNKISLEVARDAVKKAAPRAAVETGRVGTLDITVTEGVRNKVLQKPLDSAELTDMFKLVAVMNR